MASEMRKLTGTPGECFHDPMPGISNLANIWNIHGKMIVTWSNSDKK